MQYVEHRFLVAATQVDLLWEALAICDWHAVSGSSQADGDYQVSLFGKELPADVQALLADHGAADLGPPISGRVEDWLADAPVPLAPGWWVVPTADADVDGESLHVAPNTAFGDGRHPSTRITARLLLTLDLQGRRVLDLGCGTGVLGALATRRGASWVGYADVCPDAMAVVARTVSDNGLSAGGLWCSDVLADLPTDLTVEVVIGNLYADLVDRLLVDQRLDSLLPQGPLILSGIAEDRVGAIEKLLAECGWQLGARDQEGWWHGLVAVR